MAKDADQSKKLREIEERRNIYLARRVEEQDTGALGSHEARHGATDGGSAGHASSSATGIAEGETQQPTVDHVSNDHAAVSTPLRKNSDKLTTGRTGPATDSAAQAVKGGEIDVQQLGYGAGNGLGPQEQDSVKYSISSFQNSISSLKNSISSLKSQVQSEVKSKYDVCELYSRPRMCAHAQTHKLDEGGR